MKRVGQDDALDRRVRDVALVPQRDVLDRRHGVATEQPRETADLLAPDRVALVRHRGRALLALRERLLDFPDLRLLQAANLERELLERRAGDRKRGQQLRVAIALDDLRRDGRGLEPEPTADGGLDRRRQVGEGADRARDLADAPRFARAPHAHDVALQLGVPERQLQAEGHGLGVHAVRAADHRRLAMLFRARPDGVSERVQVLQDQVARVHHLQRQRRVHHVRRRQAEVEIARRRADVLGDRRRERDDVVLRGLLDFLDAPDVERRLRPEVACRVGRDDARLRHRVGRGELDREPRLVPALLGPDPAHFGAGVPRDHQPFVAATRVKPRSRGELGEFIRCLRGKAFLWPLSGGRLLAQIQLLGRQLQAVLLAEHRGAQRSAGEQLARDADDVFGRHALDALDRLVEPELAIEIHLLPRQVATCGWTCSRGSASGCP